MVEKPTYEELEKRIQELEEAGHKHERTELALQRRLEFEQLVKEISSYFAGVRGADSIDSVINRALSSVGTFTGADRAYIFSFKDGGPRADNTHEWCADGIEPQIENLKDIPIDEELPWFAKHMRNQEVFHVPSVAELPHEALRERKHFEAQHIQSLIVVPMETAERLMGFLGFDAVTERQIWSEDDKAILQFFAQTLSHVIERKRAEKSLKDSQAFLQKLIDAIPTPVFYKNRDGIYLGFNRAFETLFGKKKELMIGKSVFEINPPELAEIYHAKDDELFKSKGAQRYESQWKTASGELRDFIFNKAVFADSNGNVNGLIGVLTDITERKEAEERLTESEGKYRLIFEGADVLVSVYDRNGVCELMNHKVAAFFGGEPSDFRGKTFEELHPDKGKDYARRVKEVIDSGSSKDFEDEVLFPQGSRWLLSKVQPIQNANGKINAAQIISQDITKRKQAEEALRKSEEKFSRFFFSSPTWLAFTRLEDGKYLEVNHSFEEVSGFTREEVIGKSSLEIGLWHEPEKRKILMNLAKEKGGFQQQEVVFRTKEGDPLPVLWSAVVIELDMEECLLSTVMDISELRRSEEEKGRLQKELQQAHKMEAIGNLAGGIAHEFNNVLGIILGNAELALDDVPDWNPAKESLKEIRTASFRAKEVVRQILSFARKTMTSLKPLEINTITEESLKLLRASIPSMIDIQSNIPPEPKMILGDPTELHQIIINLCTNAAHAMRKTGGVLKVDVSEVRLGQKTAVRYEDLAPGDFVKLAVKDSGEGIAPDVLEKVFEPYFTTKEFGAGSGMGLAVVYGIVKKCKGAIDVRSTLGKGTIVEILFPKIEEEAPSKMEIQEELPTGNERILLVDDDESIVRMVRQMLERLGYSVFSMTDSVAALDHFRSNSDALDLVITDMAMPHMAGDQLAAELIKVRKDIPILLCTGHSDTIDEASAKNIGIRAFAMKPLDIGKLARSVRNILDRSK